MKVVGDMSVLDARLKPTHATTHIQRFGLRNKSDHIQLLFADETEFGFLRTNMTKGLNELLEKSTLDFEAVAENDSLRETIGRAAKPAEALVRVSINIYGPQDEADDVGSQLSDHKLWLQKPDYSRRDLPYKNPHVLEFEGLDLSDMDKPTEVMQRAAPKPRSEEEHLRQTVAKVYNSASRQEGLIQIAVTGNFRNPVLK